MRVTTALNRLLALRGVSVTGVRLTGEGVMVRVRLRRRRIACSVCGQVYTGMHDRDVRRWRHLDLAGHRCFLEYELRRVDCRDCGVRVEAVPWARRGARHTRDFEDLVAFCAQQMAKSQVQSLLRVAWDTVGRIIERVVADHLDERRLDGLIRSAVDEMSYRRGQRYLTNVADHAHRPDRVERPRPQRPDLAASSSSSLGERKDSIRAVSIDMSPAYEKRDPRRATPTRRSRSTRSTWSPSPARAVDEVRRASGTPRASRRPRAGCGSSTPAGRCSRRPRSSPTANASRSPGSSRPTSGSTAPTYSRSSCARSTNSTTAPSTRAPRRLDRLGRRAPSSSHSSDSPAPCAATATASSPPIRLDLTNARLEGLHNKIRLLSHRSYGFHSPHALIALIYLCCAGITITPPLR